MAEWQKKVAALKYKHGEDLAPKVVAKGRGSIGEKILEIARLHGIPVREDKNLVEVLSSLDLYEEIPPELYKAVAEILAFVYMLNTKAKEKA
jgi:flagellar biosynthesis protein